MSAVTATVAVLLADSGISAVAGARVWGMEIPRDCTEHEAPCTEARHMPRACIVVKPSGGAGTGQGARSYAPWHVRRFDVFAYAETPNDANSLAEQVYDFMTQLRQILAAGTLLKDAVAVAGPIPNRDPDTDWPYAMSVFEVSSTPGS